MSRLLRIRKLADTSGGRRVPRYNPLTGEKVLVDPDSPQTRTVNDPETGDSLTVFEEQRWPLLGIRIEGEAPERCDVSMRYVEAAESEGWMRLEGKRVVHRSGGPKKNPWRVTHTFVHADAIVIDTVDGEVRYRVVENPDKWPDEKNEETGFGGEVRWYYELALEAETEDDDDGTEGRVT